MQSHYSMTSPTIAAVKVAIQKYNQIDPGKIEIQLTELDIHNTFRTAADQKSVATKYQSLFNMLVDSRRKSILPVLPSGDLPMEIPGCLISKEKRVIHCSLEQTMQRNQLILLC